jgi:hypothetical protein
MGSLTLLTRLTSELPGGRHLIAQREGVSGVDDLPLSEDFPQAVIGVRVTNRDVAAFFEAMRDDAAVPPVPDPLGELAFGNALDAA